jgi:hypothetical protein
MQGHTENFIPVVPVEEGYLLHTPENPFCPVDPSCPCHEDPSLIDEIAGFVREGLLTPQEATDFVSGKMV